MRSVTVKKSKILLSLDAEVTERIRESASRLGLNKSTIVEQACRSYLRMECVKPCKSS